MKKERNLAKVTVANKARKLGPGCKHGEVNVAGPEPYRHHVPERGTKILIREKKVGNKSRKIK